MQDVSLMSGSITGRFTATHGEAGRSAEMVCHKVRHDGGLELAHRQAFPEADDTEAFHTETKVDNIASSTGFMRDHDQYGCCGQRPSLRKRAWPALGAPDDVTATSFLLTAK